jgi:ubiquinone/menaquinone biosynthesis C-methylase UbiE
MLAADRQRFVEDYLRIRRAEGRGSDDPEYYFALPFRDLSGTLNAQWAMRGRTYRYFERKILLSMECGRPLDVLDVGAGCGWLSYRLAMRGHRPVAVDLLSDGRDGLGAARHYVTRAAFARFNADFDQLPFANTKFDAVIFNASVHYSSNYFRTLAEARRCLRSGGRIVILDSPIYKLREHGEMMRRERRREFAAKYGTESDHIGSIEYLDEDTIDKLSREVGIAWRIHKPWYGFAWHSRPVKAWCRGKRPPSRFWILEGIVE